MNYLPTAFAQLFFAWKLYNHALDGKISREELGSGLIDHIQKMTMAAMTMADMKVWAQRS